MVWLIFILALLFSVLFLVLVLPLEVDIDSERQLFEARWYRVVAIRLEPGFDRWRWYYRFFNWEKEWRLEKKKTEPGPETKPVKKKSKKSKSKRSFTFRQARMLLKNIWRAIKLRRLWVNWDTDNFVLNARLYPLFRMLSQGKRQFFINFSGEQALAIHLQTRLGLLALAALRVLFISKK